MPDFEIRYYKPDDQLAVVHMCTRETLEGAVEFARAHLKDYARFEVRAGDGSPLATV